MKTLEQFKAEQMTDREFATKYEKICLELENEKTEIQAEYELKNNDKLKEILEDSENIALQFREFVEKKTSEYDEDEEEIGFLTLGYRLIELALMFSLMEEDGKCNIH